MKVKDIVLSGVLMALGIVLPFFTGQIPEIGAMLLPMHIPVLLCGIICGGRYGLIVGLVLPLLRAGIFGRPVMFPTAVAMAFEMATYGLIIGVLYSQSKKNVLSIYISLIISMLAGRVVWGGVMMVLSGVNGAVFTWGMFVAGAVFNAVPGIILQLILVPAVIMVYKHIDKVNTTEETLSSKSSGKNSVNK